MALPYHLVPLSSVTHEESSAQLVGFRSLPIEIVLKALEYLPIRDLLVVSYVSRRLQVLAERFIWRNAQFEVRKLYGYIFHEKPYIRYPRGFPNNRCKEGARREVFWKICENLSENQSDTWSRRADALRLLEACSLPPNMRFITSFKHLRRATIHCEDWVHPEPKLPQMENDVFAGLKEVRLSGFIPLCCVRLFLGCPENITFLALHNLLRPAHQIVSKNSSSCSDSSKNNTNLPQRERASLEDGGDPYWHGPEFVDGTTTEVWYGEYSGPNSLVGFLKEIQYRFKSLTHLHLCKPSQATTLTDESTLWNYPAELDREVLTEWASFLTCVRSQLVDLTLEHRQAVEGSWLDGVGQRSPAIKSSGEPGDLIFCDVLLPTLFEQSGWPKLKTFKLIGIELNQEGFEDREQHFCQVLGKQVHFRNLQGRQMILKNMNPQFEQISF